MTVEGKECELETVSKWDGESCVASLEASNGVTKCRGLVFAPQHTSAVSGYSFRLRLTRGNGVGFVPMIGEWLTEVSRVGEVLYTGPMQEISTKEWTEFTCEVPGDKQVLADTEHPVMLGFYTEECVSHRSSSAEIAHMTELLEAPTIPASLYLNGKFATGTWRTYEGTLICRISYMQLEEVNS
mmetsp:Transcript_19679/g.48303  ORF Transcript_19679/g.48303 Transcript_19679/m.48303 type:complete len:184 (-) Transcript_19679:63-614(-)